MERRAFLVQVSRLAGLAAMPGMALAANPAQAAKKETLAPLLLQTSPLAGFQYHHGEYHWADMRPGDALTLTREPDNRHDARAIRVDWKSRTLGYVPRVENATLASLMDRGHHLCATLAAKQDSPDPWKRIRFAVYLVDGHHPVSGSVHPPCNLARTAL